MTQATTQHTTTTETNSGPHIPALQAGSTTDIITPTVMATWAFMVVLFVLVGIFRYQFAHKSYGRIRMGFQLLTKTILDFAESFLGDKKFALQNLSLIATLFVIVGFGNLFGLCLEMLASFHPAIGHMFRPMNSDLNSTLVLGLGAILISQGHGVAFRGLFSQIKSYVFNFSGHSFGAKISNVFFGWLHLIGELARVTSLSFRLFGNIYAGVILISVMNWLSAKVLGVPFLAPVPFFIFEVLISLFQGFIFILLTLLYFKQQRETEH